MTTRTRPPRLCSCGKIVAHGTRCACQITATRERNARHDARRPSGSVRYPYWWRKARRDFLVTHPYCAMCSAPAKVVDHIIPHRNDPALFENRRNWQALCFRCHNSTKQRMERRPRP